MHKPIKKSFIAQGVLAIRRRWHYYFRLSGIRYPDQVVHAGRSIFYQAAQWIALLGIVSLWATVISLSIDILDPSFEVLLGVNALFFILVAVDSLPLLSFFLITPKSDVSPLTAFF